MNKVHPVICTHFNPACLIQQNPILSLVSVVVVILSTIIIKVFYTNDNRLYILKQVIPGPPQLPLFGNTFQLLGSSSEILQTFSKWVSAYGPRVLYRIGNYWIVTLAGAKDLEKFLSSTTETFKSVDYEQFIPWLGEGLLISSGQKWTQRRKMLTHAFHFKILEQFFDIFNEHSKLLASSLKEGYSNGENFEISQFITKCTLEIICETAMGVKISGQAERGTEYIKALDRIKKLQLYRGLRPWLESRFVWDTFSYGREELECIKILHAFTHRVIAERKIEFLADRAHQDKSQDIHDGSAKLEKKRLALLDLMFQAQLDGEAFDDAGIREETETFMFGGHDTTATAAAFTIFHIGNHPEVQAKVHQELDEVFGDDLTRPVTAEDLPKLKYLECCIKESMRLTSPVPLTSRVIKYGFELEKGIVLPPETMIMFFPFQLHRDPEVFPDPLEYKPERFLPENCAGRNSFAYLPFSAGLRNCIGQKFAMMEEKILLANIFRNLRIESCEKLQDLVLSANIVLHSENGINVKIRSRF